MYVAACLVLFGITFQSECVSNTTASLCGMPLGTAFYPFMHSHIYTCSLLHPGMAALGSNPPRESLQGYSVLLTVYSGDVGCLLLCKCHGPACPYVHLCVCIGVSQEWL